MTDDSMRIVKTCFCWSFFTLSNDFHSYIHSFFCATAQCAICNVSGWWMKYNYIVHLNQWVKNNFKFDNGDLYIVVCPSNSLRYFRNFSRDLETTSNLSKQCGDSAISGIFHRGIIVNNMKFVEWNWNKKIPSPHSSIIILSNGLSKRRHAFFYLSMLYRYDAINKYP